MVFDKGRLRAPFFLRRAARGEAVSEILGPAAGVPPIPAGVPAGEPTLAGMQWHLAQILVRVDDLRGGLLALGKEVQSIHHAQGDQRQEVVMLSARLDSKTAQQTADLNRKLDAQTNDIARKVDVVIERIEVVEREASERKATMERLKVATDQLATKEEVGRIAKRVDKVFEWRYVIAGASAVIGVVVMGIALVVEHAPAWISLLRGGNGG